ncbi:uncharacterized protein MELLADRAFT_105200 [Melampsora larici-populina 98AG31]|uniref:Uncharacterized protein n=1 Tax=Melampsora larici-populina (strain 98AG31 / pathotype 3-4-7) TaxID=747676 RepID=F4RH08_MELLP|nr:uncharacterized protein MELLADRAFT_105200 [Melampsora larici-populina 98AG31]EGG08223.1 hypothetical protein MELLADRAFT_105200 [Melampsora larici-populina 98AG31]
MSFGTPLTEKLLRRCMKLMKLSKVTKRVEDHDFRINKLAWRSGDNDKRLTGNVRVNNTMMMKTREEIPWARMSHFWSRRSMSISVTVLLLLSIAIMVISEHRCSRDWARYPQGGFPSKAYHKGKELDALHYHSASDSWDYTYATETKVNTGAKYGELQLPTGATCTPS